ncbi:GDSL-type esterase/lipase family protein [Xanthobacter sp. DSM 24535]|uniref:GDSL-type esterase/lipase family protein n=1 Tax=Roseixanthobacter psychrophilus TaxID=3119917 RepID=UPI003727F56F
MKHLVLALLVFWLASLNATFAAEPDGDKCDAAETELASAIAIADTSSSVRRHNMLVEHLPPSADVVFLGDSIVQLWPQDLIESTFDGMSVLNLGVGRDKIRNVRFRLHDARVSLSKIHPRYVISLVGTNDLGLHERPCVRDMQYQALSADIREIWPDARQVMVGILPRGPGLKSYTDERAQADAAMHRALEHEPRSFYVNLDSFISCESETSCASFRPDMVHPSRLGFIGLSNGLKKFIQSIK